jgi:hypothetical protein
MIALKVRRSILREQYDDLKRRIDALDVEPRLVCFNYIKSTYGPVNEGYELASSADRERIFKELRDVSRRLWSVGNRPQALAFGVLILNIESQLTPADDAAFVKQATEALIKESTA